jgi:hypothetical protein
MIVKRDVSVENAILVQSLVETIVGGFQRGAKLFVT